MIGDAVGRGDFELSADLLNRRREALFPNGLEQEIVDRLLPGSQRWQHGSGILKIYSVVNRARKARWNGVTRAARYTFFLWCER